MDAETITRVRYTVKLAENPAELKQVWNLDRLIDIAEFLAEVLDDHALQMDAREAAYGKVYYRIVLAHESLMNQAARHPDYPTHEIKVLGFDGAEETVPEDDDRHSLCHLRWNISTKV